VVNPLCPPCRTEEIAFAVTRDQTNLEDPCRLTGIVLWIVCIALPVQPDPVINELHGKVDLKVVSSIFLACIAFPFFFALVRKEDCELESSMDNTLQYPAEKAQVPGFSFAK
jgi:hypothetical protein